MKKIFILLTAAAALFSAASCQKSPVEAEEYGFLSFEGLSLGIDEGVETKAISAASPNYVIIIQDSEGVDVMNTTYGAVKNEQNDYQIKLPAGNYNLVARSADEVPVSEFERPVYGTSKEFSIAAGQVTEVGELVCSLLQCKVTVSYSDEFLSSVTGQCKTSVEVKEGYPLEYALNANGTYDKRAGYFNVEGNTMTVVFSGSIDGKNQKMTKSYTNVTAKQWRQIKFVKKVNEQGNAIFDIEIADLISDATLNNVIPGEESILGEDPDAPKGDGGITLEIDYEAGCDAQITDLENIEIVPVATRDMKIRFKATVPNGIKKFNVNIDSDNGAFLNAVDAADAREINLISPSEANGIIFDVVPFPHGADLLGKTEVDFNLDAAQDAIVIYKGKHTFSMVIIDNTGCRNVIPVAMIVK